ncbi:putative PFY1-profilin [Tilletiaria anomala UBC 951]|uniref:Profilin n=1 Tax=Tilletiaria anomala (strain ATCC 24038 / CBS 436.72 / UBC 951) TaxID=1037660 RepID=A0A066W3E0_TILAU|nr:putative PFY1-profilin [Tilletiaria anomala UBC 951]KDN45285.1 putative PFY1-profilin [Tilletiaria anomala UBC 951]
MSWQTYVDTNLLGSGRVSHAAILGLKGGVWATSSGFALTPEEQRTIVSTFDAPDTAQANGIRAAGRKYFCLKADGRSVYGKQGADGIVCVKTAQCVLVCVYLSPIVPGEANKVVESLGDYLISAGF